MRRLLGGAAAGIANLQSAAGLALGKRCAYAKAQWLAADRSGARCRGQDGGCKVYAAETVILA